MGLPRLLDTNTDKWEQVKTQQSGVFTGAGRRHPLKCSPLLKRDLAGEKYQGQKVP